MKKREYSKRHIKILALQRCSRAISLATKNDLLVPREFPLYGADYPYRTELDLECQHIAQELRIRLAKLAEREWPKIKISAWDSDQLNLTKL